jgi:hypothetical protein
MPINVGLIDRAIRQPLETITVTAGTVQESLLGTPEDLPLTEPGTSQIIFTVQEANLPILSYGSCTNAGVISCSGRNLSGSYATIYYRILKNGSSAYTGSKTYISYSGYYNLSFDL